MWCWETNICNLVFYFFSVSFKITFGEQVPIVPYGGATSIEGHTLSPHGGVCIDMSLMKVCACSIMIV